MPGEAKYPSRNFCLALYCLGHSRSLSLHAGVLPSLECGDRQDFCSCQPGVSVDTLTPWSSGLGQRSAGQGLAPKSSHLSARGPAPPLPSSTLQFPPLPSPPLPCPSFLSLPSPPLPSCLLPHQHFSAPCSKLLWVHLRLLGSEKHSPSHLCTGLAELKIYV